MAKLFANSGDPDQTLHSTASDPNLHCLPTTFLGVSRLRGYVIKTECGHDAYFSLYKTIRRAMMLLKNNMFEKLTGVHIT